ncbi:MAG: hypothetical protein HDR01_05635 [Lachnospiraceae bacterium]|nr:hypothetical protein [Lachnospiraceae bacterium]
MNELFPYCIYKHTFPNGKVYIGMTEIPNIRFGTDGTGYKNNVPMYEDIKKYGWNNVETEILKNGLSLEEAQQQEREFIIAYNSEDSQIGYNQTSLRKTILNTKGEVIDKGKKPDKKPITPWGSNMDYKKFVKSEVEYIQENGNFTKIQNEVFELRVKGMSLEQCAKEIGVSISTINRTSAELRKKIKKIMQG